MLDNHKNNQHQRLLHLDLLRLIAIFLVVFNHTGDRGYMLFANSTGSLLYFPYMMFSVFCKIAVPIFFMISGALLLPKQESLKQLFSKRILRMIVVLVLISVPYYYWLHRSQGIGALSFFTYIYGQSASTALWYLYSYVSLLLMMPFLRNMVTSMKQKDFIYLFVGHIVLVGILPCLEYCLWQGNTTIHESFSPVIFLSQNFFFALTGYYLEHVLGERHYNKKTIFFSVLLSVTAILVTCLMTYYQTLVMGTCSTEQLESFFNCFICIPAMSVYVLVRFLGEKIKRERTKKVLSILGAGVFGVYLIEKFVRALTSGVYTLLSPFVGSFAAALVWCLATVCLGVAIVLPLKHIPFVKSIVNKFI